MGEFDNFIGSKFDLTEAERKVLNSLWFEPIEMRLSDPEGDKRRRAGHIYLFFDGSELYKIGLAQDVARRLKQVRRRYRNESITLLHYFLADDMDRAEQGLHVRYSDRRRHDEWFALEVDQINQILNISQYKNGEFILAAEKER